MARDETAREHDTRRSIDRRSHPPLAGGTAAADAGDGAMTSAGTFDRDAIAVPTVETRRIPGDDERVGNEHTDATHVGDRSSGEGASLVLDGSPLVEVQDGP